MTICNMNYKEVGPFAQTLFMGCSIVSITHNMAWGSEASTCGLKLIKDLSSHPSHSAFGSTNTNLETIINTTTPSTLFDSPDLSGTDAGKTLQKGIAQQEKDLEIYRQNNDIIGQIAKNQDIGKKCWNPHNLGADPVGWKGPDPGFIGDNLVIGGRLFGSAGVPCYARFDDLMFGGIIGRWTLDGGTYTVDLYGPGSMLKGTQLIVNDYYGSIATSIGATAGALADGSALSVPFSDTTINSFNSNIYQGNIPNVINIFGYLQNQGFNTTLFNANGVNAAQIYDTLLVLLNNSNGIQKNQFNPYGAIVGKSLVEYMSNGDVSIVAPQDMTISHDGVTINLTQLGFLNHKMAVDQVYRPLFRLDLSNVPRPNDNLYLPLNNVISLDEFIKICCDGAGLDWNLELLPDLANSDFTGRIIVNVYNRNVQPPPKVLKNLITSFGASDRVVSYSVGEEYSDENTRKIIVGGKQERIFQVMSHTLSKYRNIRAFDPATGAFSNVGSDLITDFLVNGNVRNTVRWPDPSSTRAYDSSLGGGLPYRRYGGAATAQTANDFLASENLGFSNVNVTKGSYSTTTPALDDSITAGVSNASYPLYHDLISPYFGRSTDGSVRPVFYDRKMRQIQVNVNLIDIEPFFPVYDDGTFSGYITIYENEIRAAIAGYDSWISYVTDAVKLGYKTPTTKLIYAFIKLRYGEDVANSIMLSGVGALKTDSKLSALPVPPHTGDHISPGAAAIHLGGIYTALQKLHTFIESGLGDHYGKNFLVRIPNIKRRVDTQGIAHYSYEICDSGWEEEGNFIDDTMQIGSFEATSLAQEDGKFGPLLGFNASAEWDNTVFENLNSNDFGLLTLSDEGRILLQMRSLFESMTSDKWYYPLVHDIPPEDVVYLPYTNYFTGGVLAPGWSYGVPTVQDSFANVVPADKKYKMYIKADILEALPENRTNKNILFANGAQYCVVSTRHNIYCRSSNSLVKTLLEDLYLSSTDGYEIPGGGGPYGFNIPPVAPNQLLFLLAIHDHLINSSAFVPSIGLNSEDHVPISPKCPVPCFAAIPIRDNLSIYGPWTNHPGFISSSIFTDRSDNGAKTLANNIVGGVDVDIADSYVPWEYGGMDNLDTAMLATLSDSNKYQQVLEAGTLVLAGIMLRNTNIGSRIINNNGPVCNCITLDIGSDGFRTTYHFRTYSRKLGYFNKEQATLVGKFGKLAINNRKQIISSIRSQLSRQMQLQDPATDRAGRLPKALNYSPVNLLFGGAYPMVHKNSSLTNVYEQLKFTPAWNIRPIVPNAVPSNPKDMLRHQTVTQIYDSQEIGEILVSRPADYGQRSIMSLDGIFSPISFYPVPYGTTYPIAPYPRSKCPYCKGQGTHNYRYYGNASTDLDSSNRSRTTTNRITSQLNFSSVNCAACYSDDIINKWKKTSAKPNEISPPFLIASGTDAQIISDRDIAFQYNSCIINTYSLNPLVMSATGSDFSCAINKQRNDMCGHSIDVVAFGNTLPKFNDGLRASLSNTINKNYSDYDINLISADPSNSGAFQNMRFFGLRGPLMLHSWGYDLEGYPVPNSSGEYQYDSTGQRLTDKDNNYIYKNQKDNGDGTYTAPYKENTFYKGWAQLPTTWPVGPIDLRWDDGAKVWTVGSNYKPVWVVIETDLLSKDPVRGTIIESAYDNSPLPSGLRKLVFVKDTIGMFSAPRGAALYCRYDSQNGFYEPIYNRPLVTTGIIDSVSSATIYKAYVPTGVLLDDDVTNYTSAFDNPLDLDTNIGSVGLFTFLNGKWILQSIRT